MNITLKPELEQYVQTQIESGRYGSPEEVITASVQLMEMLSSDRPETRPLYEMYVIERYRNGEISAGKLGEFLGLSRWEAEVFLHDRGVDLPYDEADLAQDMATVEWLEAQRITD